MLSCSSENTYNRLMDAKTFVIHPKNAISETLDNETIIINIETGSYYSMNQDGTALWRAIGESKAIPLQNPTISAFVGTLLSEGLIQETGQHGALAEESAFQAPSVDIYTDMQEMILTDPIHDVDATGWPQRKE